MVQFRFSRSYNYPIIIYFQSNDIISQLLVHQKHASCINISSLAHLSVASRLLRWTSVPLKWHRNLMPFAMDKRANEMGSVVKGMRLRLQLPSK